MKESSISIVISCLAVAFVLGNCAPVQINGGGTLPSTSGNAADKANFGFDGNSCGPAVTGTFNYHDKKATGWPDGGAKLNGTVSELTKCSEWDDSSNYGIACGICNLQFCNCPDWPDNWQICALEFLDDPVNYCQGVPIPDNLYGAGFRFRSTNPRYRGDGAGVACLTDNGEGSEAIDNDNVVLIIGVGQYEGYTNQGAVQGNISAQPCS